MHEVLAGDLGVGVNLPRRVSAGECRILGVLRVGSVAGVASRRKSAPDRLGRFPVGVCRGGIQHDMDSKTGDAVDA